MAGANFLKIIMAMLTLLKTPNLFIVKKCRMTDMVFSMVTKHDTTINSIFMSLFGKISEQEMYQGLNAVQIFSFEEIQHRW